MVDLLIRRGANVNAKTDKKKVTPLHIASQNNKHKIAELLIQHGAVVDALSPAGFTPLHFTNFSGDLRIAELLLKNGANVRPSFWSGNKTSSGKKRINSETSFFSLSLGKIVANSCAVNNSPKTSPH